MFPRVRYVRGTTRILSDSGLSLSLQGFPCAVLTCGRRVEGLVPRSETSRNPSGPRGGREGVLRPCQEREILVRHSPTIHKRLPERSKTSPTPTTHRDPTRESEDPCPFDLRPLGFCQFSSRRRPGSDTRPVPLASFRTRVHNTGPIGLGTSLPPNGTSPCPNQRPTLLPGQRRSFGTRLGWSRWFSVLVLESLSSFGET